MQHSDAEMPPRVGRAKSGTSAYHTADPELAKMRKARHEASRPPRQRTVPVRQRRVIAWDGEGIKLSGPRHPQHYVLFGCSADTDNPLVIDGPKDDLDFYRLADYIVSIGDRYPKAIHVGYFFKYDHNMIVKSLPWPMKAALYEKNRCRAKHGIYTYAVSWIPGKSITISRKITGSKRGTSVTIDDIGPFFASSFVSAYTRALKPAADDATWRVVVEGKAMRADTTYDDMETVARYWRAEIVALEQLAVWFRDLMCDAGFPLTKWYGPGALANLLRKRHSLGAHEWGGKVDNMPPEVHDASKRAYFGGHVEQFQAGRIIGPVYLLDINSAYPAAFAGIPSLRKGGEWRHVTGFPTDRPPQEFSVWQTCYMDRRTPAPARPQPLPHRDPRKEITYPPMVRGWYWLPEMYAARYAARMTGASVQVVEGWEWWPAREPKVEYPWSFMHDMYVTRARLKAQGNPLEMPFKLGLNSMYGKMAQRAGWDQETHAPPRSHTLPIAGYVTAWCRARMMKVIQDILRVNPDGVIAVETDGVFTTVPPEQLGITPSAELGAWSCDVYDELMYVQNGVYLLRRGDKWVKVKARGMSVKAMTPELMSEYLHSLAPGEAWEPLRLAQGEVFVGLGAAIARATTTKGQIAWPKANALHCRWQPQEKDVVPGQRGKRRHFGTDGCPACASGFTAYEAPHTLRATGHMLGLLSMPYQLPWEHGYTETKYDESDRQTEWEYRDDE